MEIKNLEMRNTKYNIKEFEREKAEISFFLGTSAIKRWKYNKNMF